MKICCRGGVNQDFIEFWKHWISALRNTNSKLLAYMVFMTERLVEMKRLLKKTGSIYLHCDPTASHYIKVIMDGVFGHENFRNEIVWERSPIKGAKATSKQFGRNIDIIFFYSKTNKYCFQQIYKEYDLTAKHNKFKFTDVNGRIYSRDCPLGDYSEESIAKFEAEGRIYITKNGKKQLIRYLDEMKGIALGSIWNDIKPINQVGKERLGYPTQKPLALLDRIIKASCPEDGVIFDPFCGCGTTVISAEQNKRRWIGADICMLAINSVEARLTNLFPMIKKGKDYCLDGLPTTLEQAIALANSSNTTKTEGRYQFQYWAVEKVGGFCSNKKSGDGGVDGAIYFYKDAQSNLGKMILSVKSDKKLAISYIRDLIGTLSSHKSAEMAGLICIDEPTEGMKQEVLKAGFYDIEFMGHKQSFQKVQILTIKDIIENNAKFQTPFTVKKKIAEHVNSQSSSSVNSGQDRLFQN